MNSREPSLLPIKSPYFFAETHFHRLEHWPSEATPKAAVVLAFYRSHSSWQLLFIRRALHLDSHRGQIGFPGGLSEIGESPAATALREFEEEMGVSTQNLHLLGCLDPVLSIGGVSVVPVVAFSEQQPVFSPSADEVDSYFLIDVTQLVAWQSFKFNLFGEWRESDLFTTSTIKIWGLSARILKNAGFPEVLLKKVESIEE
jgi:8-oxo-dGTP pyrophosphatase MutT (NUDIX family)